MTDRDPASFEGPFAEAYAELRRLASAQLGRRAGHTLQPTAIVHEVFLRLAKSGEDRALARTDCLHLAARAMRSVLVDHARRRNALKRGGDAQRVPLDEAVAAYEERSTDLCALDEALDRLATFDSGLARLIDLRFFGGLSIEETARELGVSERTVYREWQLAKSWLQHELGEDAS
ncbi:MAG: ECF-type sigma factor [Planctomycetota bacterium]